MGWWSLVAVKIGIISDIHSNLAAFEAVLKQLADVKVIWSLGDVVGYTAEANETINQLKNLKIPYVHIAGNHDLGAVNLISRDDFNVEGKIALDFTERLLTRENRLYLLSLPQTCQPRKEILLVHASPRDPVWEYLLTTDQAAGCFQFFHHSLCFFGHTHVPVMYTYEQGQVKKISPKVGEVYHLNLAQQRYLINPGSVGQPRDSNPQASYCVFNLEKLTVTWRRVSYDIKKTQTAIKQAGLPLLLANRLSYGL